MNQWLGSLSDHDIYWVLTLYQLFFQELPTSNSSLKSSQQRGETAAWGGCSTRLLVTEAANVELGSSGHTLLTTLGASYSKQPLPPSLFSLCAFHLGCPPSCPPTDLTSFYSPESPLQSQGPQGAFLGHSSIGLSSGLRLQVCLLWQTFSARGKGLSRRVILYPPIPCSTKCAT